MNLRRELQDRPDDVTIRGSDRAGRERAKALRRALNTISEVCEQLQHENALLKKAIALVGEATAPRSAAATRPRKSGPGEGSLRAVERQHIIEVLRQTRGVIEGPRGAARVLGLKPSTARFRIRKLGITKADLGS